MHENIHAAGVFSRHVIGDIEVGYRSGDLRRKSADIEFLESLNSGLAGTYILPGGFDIVADRGNDPHAGYDDTSITQVMIRVIAAELPSSMNGFEKLVQRSCTAPT
jgi:hypothetical protein